MIHVYTGNGKGKTTAAIGLAIRAYGRKKRVKIIQFMKNGGYGEIMALKKLGIDVEQFGRAEFVDRDNPERVDMELAEKALARALDVLPLCDLLVLDEINVAIDYRLIKLEDTLELMEKAKDMELVLTGRYANERIIEKADYVTEMREIKHPYRRGIEGREGVEF
ncbi:MAG: cob(I)yrinic acid a,c-diamide adenosyltransferase [Candidatus Thermoplasmatota archaeon]|nr:cob(I)yrinic acid a,c-diamide adenosyltransferase [Candidatus Thermoplasmatota archaeon]